MLVPVSWLKDYVDIDMPLPQLTDRLTMAGLALEGLERQGDWWDPATILVGQVVGVKPHPNADKLVLVEVNYGAAEPEQVVTGAPNLFQYKETADLPVLKVAFARSGAVLIDAYSDQEPRPKKKLKPSKIRGIPSSGMVCSERELGLSDEHEGILLLPEDAPVGTPLRDYLGKEVLDLEVTPDMARCLSMIGIAREVAALTNVPLKLPPDEQQLTSGTETANYINVEIADSDLCNRYTAMLIKDVKIGPSPLWMQEYLLQAGMRPINNVVDIANYVMLEWGQPLHTFDYDLLKQRAERSGQQKPTITVRRARAGEKMTTLDGVERELDEAMLMITDTLGSIALAGVMGGEETEVNDHSRNILLEAATFDNVNNRRTAQRLKLHSEASYRFTRGVPATLNPIGARRAAALMRDYAGGQVVPGIVDAYPVPQEQNIAYTTASDMRRILGQKLELETVAESLRRLDFVCESLPALPASREELGLAAFGLRVEAGEPVLRCTAPWYRLDIQMPADLCEEVARILGYEHIPLTMLEDVLPPPHMNLEHQIEEKIRDILIGCGLQETVNYSLTSPENHDRLERRPLGTAEQDDQFITLLNPLNVKRRVMRRSMLVSALENLAYNIRYTTRLATFEIGRVYLPEKGKDKRPLEERRFSILLYGPRRLPSVHADPAGAEHFDFFDLKGMLEMLFARLGIAEKDVEYVAKRDNPSFAPACAEIKLYGATQGIMGEIHPLVLQNFDLPATERVYVLDMAITSLVKPSWRLQPMQPISNYPPIVEDLAFVVGEEVTAAQLKQMVQRTAGSLLTNIELFDIYRGQPIEAGKKSMAYRLTYESLEGNLSDARVADVRKRIVKRVGDTLGGTLRD
ncbi:phenylalanine--tRNA ligase subunit beta [Ktedonosporobacter rubrisoli]|uniref:Phenylalanine--tRNA ligase beta subunit n=1 Tax=Ktedonosporobacter rubrisoli TaxID=2509675 RepID=A0A4P6JNF3_KTERU|nr:phenylalanine--tRNA ligase subunit beta [Ktedonosporobacter rubrisoli]QBD76804.1 phenylalanine--tRNA ligase subunit beta [Ktedonosporobacter rubrisoli]